MRVEHKISSAKLQKETKLMKVSTLESPHSRDFKKLLLEAIDETLSSLGDSSKRAIYFYLERNFSIDKQDIPNKIEEFTNAIENIFGNGAKILEIQIMEHLYKNTGSTFEYSPEKSDLFFADYTKAVRIHVGNSPDVHISQASSRAHTDRINCKPEKRKECLVFTYPA